MAIKIVELSSVAPSRGGAATQPLLPLLYFDMMWLHCPPTETLHFYSLKSPQHCFLETIATKLKHSLSVALDHFLPLASKIIFPLTPAATPVYRYAPGDSVTLTIAISDADFAKTTSNQSKAAHEFHQLVPQMPEAVHSSDDVVFSAIAIQVTLFPNQGMCIGFAHHHSVCDANNLLAFLRTWAAVHKSDGEDQYLGRDSVPFYGRDSVQDAEELGALVWDHVRTRRPTVALRSPLHLDKLRATFVLSDVEIERLRKSVFIGRRVSTFAVVCAHLWSCLAKSAAAAGDDVDDDELEYFSSPVDCRARLNPPLPETYFGNCLIFFHTTCTHGRLKGSEGFEAGADAISRAVHEVVGNERGILDGFEKHLEDFATFVKGKRMTSMAGSSRMDPYGGDYGWGRGVKYECIHTDYDGSVNLCKGRDGGVEIGLSMPKPKLDAFAAVFTKQAYTINSNL